YILVFAGCGAIVVESLTGAMGHVGIALVFGFVVSAIIYTFGHVSGAHLNPAVTISFTVSHELTPKEALTYIIAQIAGGILAILTLALLFLEEQKNIQELAYYGATLPRGSWYQSFVFELILTFILMLVIYGSAVHGKAVKSFAGLAIGFTVGLEAMFAGPITGASMNPARSIAPAIVSGNLSELWIYILAPIIGALLAGIFYTKVIEE
ncbi:aquaporin, partial [cyanobacterium G8-9]